MNNEYTLIRKYLTPVQIENERVLKQKLPIDIAEQISSYFVIRPTRNTQKHFRKSSIIRKNKRYLYLFYMNLIKLERALRTYVNLNSIDWLQIIKPQLLTFINSYHEDDTYTRIPGINEHLQELREKITRVTTDVPSGTENIELRMLIRSIMSMIYKKFVSDTMLLPPPRSERATQVQYPPIGEGLKPKPKPKPKSKTKTKKARKARPKK